MAGFVLALLGVLSSRADVVTDWNDIAVPLIRNAPNVVGTRQLALVHVAMFEAANAVSGKYTPYLSNLSAPGVSAEAAVGLAAHDLLMTFYPTNQAALDTALAKTLATVPDGVGKTNGVLLGGTVASQLWHLRGSDASTLTVSNAFPGGPGLWSPTPGGASTPVSQQYSNDLKSWLPLANFTRTDASIQLLDKDVGTVGARFYRAVAP